MMVIYMLLVMTPAQPVSWAIPAAYWSMDGCQAAKQKRFPQGNAEAMCVAFKSDEWK